MSREEQFLKFCVRASIDKGIFEQNRENFTKDLDWQYLIKQGRKARLLALIYKDLSAIDSLIPSIPPGIWQVLRRNYYATASRNALLWEELTRIVNCFQRQGVQCILLKGAALLYNIYPNIALRSMDDIDLLVRRKDLTRAHQVLTALGYAAPPHSQDFLREAGAAPINSLMYNPGNNYYFPVHLHWHLINSTWPLSFLVSNIDIDEVFATVEPTRLNGVNCLRLNPELFLIHLAHHAFIHSFSRLILLCDIVRLLAHYRGILNWRLLAVWAERFNLSGVVYYTLLFTQQALQYEIPQLEYLRPKRQNFLQKILRRCARRQTFSYQLSLLGYFSLSRGLLGKLRFIGKTILPSSHVLANDFSLPFSQLTFAHYYQRLAKNFVRLFPYNTIKRNYRRNTSHMLVPEVSIESNSPAGELAVERS